MYYIVIGLTQTQKHCTGTLPCSKVFLGSTQENLAAVANTASLCVLGFFSRKSSITQKVFFRLILF